MQPGKWLFSRFVGSDRGSSKLPRKNSFPLFSFAIHFQYWLWIGITRSYPNYFLDAHCLIQAMRYAA
jgi:hypothetical protein